MEGGSSKGPAIAGVVAIVLGAILIRMSGSQGPVRPQVLGDVIVAATTTVAPPASGSSAVAPPTTRRTSAASPKTTSANTTTTTSAPTTATTTATTTTTAPPGETTTTSPPTTAPCPTGVPVAEVRTWDASNDGQGLWHVRVGGVVTNRTGATATVDAVAIVVNRIDGSSDDVPSGERPTPYPASIADDGASSWTWEGVLASGAQPVGADATVAGWRWTDAPDRCT